LLDHELKRENAIGRNRNKISSFCRRSQQHNVTVEKQPANAVTFVYRRRIHPLKFFAAEYSVFPFSTSLPSMSKYIPFLHKSFPEILLTISFPCRFTLSWTS